MCSCFRSNGVKWDSNCTLQIISFQAVLLGQLYMNYIFPQVCYAALFHDSGKNIQVFAIMLSCQSPLFYQLNLYSFCLILAVIAGNTYKLLHHYKCKHKVFQIVDIMKLWQIKWLCTWLNLWNATATHLLCLLEKLSISFFIILFI